MLLIGYYEGIILKIFFGWRHWRTPGREASRPVHQRFWQIQTSTIRITLSGHPAYTDAENRTKIENKFHFQEETCLR